QGKIHAKTGYISGVRALSGVCLTDAGPYLFSILSNGPKGLSRDAINDVANATTPGKPYVVMDGKITWTKDPLEVFFSLNNIFNEQYDTYIVKSSFSDTKDYYPAVERNVMLGMKVRF
ncbi:MAG TPA: TonB-dependent receptor, partial [Candidatus Omnitrophota bacterium]|nr:TonB-dependent receptor [Candidatus Omnitrophota bacterium]